MSLFATGEFHSFNNATDRYMKTFITFLTTAFLGAGCASVPSPDSSASHPANPQAAQGIVPPPVPMLMNVTNMVMVKPVTEPAPEHQHGHEAHEAKPKTEEKK